MSTQVEVDVAGECHTTTVAVGESWSVAARRLAVDIGVADDPVAVDLSGEVKRFSVDPLLRVTLRPMTRGDLPDVLAWRSSAHVRRWWDDPGSLAALTEKYAPRLEGRAATSMWVWEANGRSVGLVQDYRVGDYPDYALLAPDPDATGGDYLVGRPEWIGRGVGTRGLWAWLLHVRGRRPDARHCFAAPDHRNRASLRALAKVGFTQGLWFDVPRDDGSVDTVVGCTLDLGHVLG